MQLREKDKEYTSEALKEKKMEPSYVRQRRAHRWHRWIKTDELFGKFRDQSRIWKKRQRMKILCRFHVCPKERLNT